MTEWTRARGVCGYARCLSVRGPSSGGSDDRVLSRSLRGSRCVGAAFPAGVRSLICRGGDHRAGSRSWAPSRHVAASRHERGRRAGDEACLPVVTVCGCEGAGGARRPRPPAPQDRTVRVPHQSGGSPTGCQVLNSTVVAFGTCTRSGSPVRSPQRSRTRGRAPRATVSLSVRGSRPSSPDACPWPPSRLYRLLGGRRDPHGHLRPPTPSWSPCVAPPAGRCNWRPARVCKRPIFAATLTRLIGQLRRYSLHERPVLTRS